LYAFVGLNYSNRSNYWLVRGADAPLLLYVLLSEHTFLSKSRNNSTLQESKVGWDITRTPKITTHNNCTTLTLPETSKEN